MVPTKQLPYPAYAREHQTIPRIDRKATKTRPVQATRNTTTCASPFGLDFFTDIGAAQTHHVSSTTRLHFCHTRHNPTHSIRLFGTSLPPAHRQTHQVCQSPPTPCLSLDCRRSRLPCRFTSMVRTIWHGNQIVDQKTRQNTRPHPKDRTPPHTTFFEFGSTHPTTKANATSSHVFQFRNAPAAISSTDRQANTVSPDVFEFGDTPTTVPTTSIQADAASSDAYEFGNAPTTALSGIFQYHPRPQDRERLAGHLKCTTSTGCPQKRSDKRIPTPGSARGQMPNGHRRVVKDIQCLSQPEL